MRQCIVSIWWDCKTSLHTRTTNSGCYGGLSKMVVTKRCPTLLWGKGKLTKHFGQGTSIHTYIGSSNIKRMWQLIKHTMAE